MLVGACYGKSQNQVGIQCIISQLCLNCVLFLKCVEEESTFGLRVTVFCLFVYYLLCCAFLMPPEASWHFLTPLAAFGHFLMLHYSFFCLLTPPDKCFIAFWTWLPQHQSDNKQTNKILWLWEPKVYAKISTVKKHCQLITLLIKGC